MLSEWTSAQQAQITLLVFKPFPTKCQKTRIYKQNKYTYTQCGAENSLFQFCLTVTEPFSPFYLEDMKNYQSLGVSAVSQLIMRVRKPKVEYKLALQEKPKGEP